MNLEEKQQYNFFLNEVRKILGVTDPIGLYPGIATPEDELDAIAVLLVGALMRNQEVDKEFVRELYEREFPGEKYTSSSR